MRTPKSKCHHGNRFVHVTLVRGPSLPAEPPAPRVPPSRPRCPPPPPAARPWHQQPVPRGQQSETVSPCVRSVNFCVRTNDTHRASRAEPEEQLFCMEHIHGHNYSCDTGARKNRSLAHRYAPGFASLCSTAWRALRPARRRAASGAIGGPFQRAGGVAAVGCACMCCAVLVGRARTRGAGGAGAGGEDGGTRCHRARFKGTPDVLSTARALSAPRPRGRVHMMPCTQRCSLEGSHIFSSKNLPLYFLSAHI